MGDDYEPCPMCGFDHAYEPQEAHDWHMKEEKEEFEKVKTHLEILVTGCGYQSTNNSDPGYQGLDDNEFLVWHPKTGRAYVVSVVRAPQEDDHT